MSYLGQAALKNSELKVFNVTSSTSATHVLSWTAPNEQSLFVTINGVKQQEDAYSIAGSPTTITLTDALVATDKMEVVGVVDIGVITVVGDNTISTAKLAADAVTAAKIATDAVGTSEIAANAVDTAEIAANAVTLTELADGTQGGTLYYGAAGAPTQLAAGTSGYFLKTQGAAANPIWASLTEYNDANVLNDIATLALQQATQNNQSAYNLANAFVDQYEDATGLDVLTDVVRNSGEYMTSVDATELQTTWELDTASYNSTITSTAGTNAMAIHSGSGIYTSSVLKKDFTFDAGKDVRVRFYQVDSSGNVTTGKYMALTIIASTGTLSPYTDVDNDNATNFYGRVNDTSVRDNLMENGSVGTAIGVTDYSNTSSNSIASGASQILSYTDQGGATTFYGMEFFYDASANTFLTTYGETGVNASTGAFTSIVANHRLTVTGLPSTGKFYLVYGGAETSTGVRFGINPNGVTPDNGIAGSVNATGNYTSTTETAAGTVSKMSIVVLYKNAYGTATLDTDLVAQVSANGGTNYTAAPLTAAGTFSTGILIAKSNDITISNTGTAPKYKISFANQAEASKETQVYGVALMY